MNRYRLLGCLAYVASVLVWAGLLIGAFLLGSVIR